MFYQIFFSSLQQSMIISNNMDLHGNKHGTEELPHELLSEVKLRILGN